MVKLTDNAIGMLIAKYRAILKNMFCNNFSIVRRGSAALATSFLLLTAAPAMAKDYYVGYPSDFTPPAGSVSVPYTGINGLQTLADDSNPTNNGATPAKITFNSGDKIYIYPGTYTLDAKDVNLGNQTGHSQITTCLGQLNLGGADITIDFGGGAVIQPISPGGRGDVQSNNFEDNNSGLNSANYYYSDAARFINASGGTITLTNMSGTTIQGFYNTYDSGRDKVNGNGPYNYSGGAIYNSGAYNTTNNTTVGGNVDLRQSTGITFYNNMGGRGGAIYAKGNVYVGNGQKFQENIAYLFNNDGWTDKYHVQGGAIYGSNVYIGSNNTFIGNQAREYVGVARPTFGGAVYGINSVVVSGSNNQFLNNAATYTLYETFGGAIAAGNNYANRDSSNYPNTNNENTNYINNSNNHNSTVFVSVNGVNFFGGNMSGGYRPDAAQMHWTDNDLANNVGGAIYSGGTNNGTSDGASFYDANGTALSNVPALNNTNVISSVYIGGGNTFDNNFAVGSGGAIYSGGSVTLNGNIKNTNNNISFKNVNYASSTTTNPTPNSYPSTINYTSFFNNSNNTQGLGNVFSNNTGQTAHSTDYAAAGGAIAAVGNVTISGWNEFYNNMASGAINGSIGGFGGAVYSAGNVTISGDTGQSWFGYNTAGSNTIVAYNSYVGLGGDLQETGYTINGSTGGAIYAGGNVTVNGSHTFIGNKALSKNYTNNDTAYGNSYGGAIYSEGIVLNTITNTSGSGSSTYLDAKNKADVASTIAITGSNTFDSNSAKSGGAIYAKNGVVNITGTGTGNIFTNNSATFTGSSNTKMGLGGAIYASGNINISGANTFTSNTAATSGGAIYANSAINVGGNTSFTNNMANTYGGAIYANGNSSTGNVTVTADTGNIVFQGNTMGTSSNVSNAIYFANSNTLSLNAGAKRTVSFYDTIANNNNTTTISINSGTANNSGTVFFSGLNKNLSLNSNTGNNFNTTVYGGTMKLGDNVTYGNASGGTTFTLNSGATLLSDISANTLQANNFTFKSGSILSFDVTGANGVDKDGKTADGKDATKNLSLAGTGTAALPASGNVTINITGEFDKLVSSLTYNLMSSAPVIDFTSLIANKTLTLSFDGQTSAQNRNVTLYELTGTKGTTGTNAKPSILTLSHTGDLTNSNNLTWLGGSAAGNVWNNMGANNWTGTVNNTNKDAVTQFMNKDDVFFDNTGVSNGAITLNEAVTVNSMTVSNTRGEYSFTGSGSIGSIDGSTFNLTKTGAGTLTLGTANNKYIGNTLLQGGTLNIGNNLALGVNIDPITKLNTNSLLMSSGTTLGFTGNYAIDNAVTIQGGNVFINTNGYNANLMQGLNSAQNSDNTYVASGFTKNGGGTLTLGQDSAVGGSVTVNGGNLDLGGQKLLTVGGNITFADNTMLSLDAMGKLSLQAGSINIGNNTTLNITSYDSSKDTTANNNQLRMEVVKSNQAIDGHFSNLLVGGRNVNATVTLDDYLLGVSTERVDTLDTTSSTTNSTIYVVTSGLTWYNSEVTSAHGTFNISGEFTLLSGLYERSGYGVDASTNRFGWNGSDFTKTGAGTLTFGTITNNIDNTYEGKTIIQEGTLAINSTSNLAKTSGIELYNGSTLQFNYSGTLSKNFYLGTGGGTINTSANDDALGGVTFSDAKTKISGIGDLNKTGIGTLRLETPNSYTGNTNVKEGTLILGDSAALGNSGTLNMSNSTTLGFDNDNLSFNNNVSLTGQVTVNVDTVSADENVSPKIADGIPLEETLTGRINDGTSAGTLTKTGKGILSLTSKNYYTGGTNLKEGTIEITANEALGKGTLTMSDKTTLDFDNVDNNTLSGNFTLSNAVVINGSVTIETGEEDKTFTATLAGVVSGSGGINKEEDGTLVLSGNNTYTGGTVINDGKISLGASSVLDAQGRILSGALGTGSLTINDTDANGDAGLNFTKSGLNIANNIILNTVANINVDPASFTDTLSGIISSTNGAGINKTGAGTLILSGNNTYKGTTNIGGGTLTVGSNTALGTSDVTVGDGTNTGTGATLNFGGSYTISNNVNLKGNNNNISVSGSSDNATMTGVISGGDLNKTGAGALTLANTSPNTYTGKTNINQGTLNIASNSAIGTPTSDINMSAGTTLGFTSAQPNYSLGNTINMTGSDTINVAGSSIAALNGTINGDINSNLTKTGTGTLIIGGSSNQVGGVTVSQGTVNVNSTLKDTGDANITGGTLNATNGDIIVTGAVNVSGGGTAAATGDGTLKADSASVSGAGSSLISDGVKSANPSDNSAITIAKNLTVSNGGTAAATNSGTITVGGNATVTGYVVSVSDSGSSLAADGSGSSFTVKGTVNVDNGANVSATNGGEVAVTGGVSLGNNTSLTANGSDSDISVGAAGVTVGGDNAVVSANGDGATIDITGDLTLTGNNDTVSAINKGTIHAKNLSATGSVFNLNLSGGGTLGVDNNITTGNPTTGAGTTTVVTMSNGDTNTNTISAGGDISFGDNTTITAGNGNKITAGGSLRTGNKSKLTAGNNTTIITGTGTPSADGTVSTGDNSDWTLGNNSTIATNGSDINIGNNSTLTIGNNGSIDAGSGTITVGTENGGDNDNYNGKLILGAETDLSAKDMTLNNKSILSLDATSDVVLSGKLTIGDNVELDVNNLTLADSAGEQTDNLIVANEMGGSGFGDDPNSLGFGTIKIGGVDVKNPDTTDEPSFIIGGNNIIVDEIDGKKVFVLKHDGLAWYADSDIAHGTFNVATTFTLTTVLNDRDPGFSGIGGWNGTELTKTGDGTLILAGNNTYTGTTYLNAGKLVVGADNALGGNGTTPGTVQMNGGTLGFNGSYSIGNAVSLNKGSALNSNTIEVTGNIDITNIGTANTTTNAKITGEISGGSLTKTGGGMLTLAGDNDYTGGTYLTAGGININHSNALSATGSLAMSDGTMLAFNGGGDKYTLNNTITLNGSTTFDVDKVAYRGSADGVYDDNIYDTYDDYYAEYYEAADIVTATIANVITGSGSLTKEGEGILILTKANDYSGGTILNDGTISLGQSSLNGTETTDVENSDGTTTTITKTVIKSGALGTGTLTINNDGALDFTQSGVDIANNIILNTVADINVGDDISDNDPMTDTLSGVISGTGSINGINKTGDGTLVLSGNNSYTGETDLSGGTLAAGSNNAFGTSVINADGGSLGFAAGANGLDISNNINLNSPSGLTVTVKGNTTTETLSGVISDGTGVTGTITKDGDGTLILAGASTYSGGTTLTEGTLSLGQSSVVDGGGKIASGALGTGDLTITGGGLDFAQSGVDIANDIKLNNGSTAINVGDNAVGDPMTDTLSGTISGTGGITKTGDGTLILSGKNNAYAGGTNINKGTLTVGSEGALGTNGVVTVGDGTNGATLSFGGSYTIKNKVTLKGNKNSINVSGQGDNATITGAVTGGDLNKTGDGTLTLGGDGNKVSNVNVSQGTLDVDASGTNDGSLIVTGNATITGGGTLGTTGGGTINVTGEATVSGSGSTLNADGVKGGTSSTITVGGLTADSGGTASATDGGTLTVNGDVTLGKSGSGGSDDNSTLDADDGGIINIKGDVIVEGSGDALRATDGGDININGDGTPTNTKGNLTVNGNGFEMNADGSGSTITIDKNLTVTGNNADMSATDGGSIKVLGSADISGSGSTLSADGVNTSNPTDKSDITIAGTLTVGGGGTAEATNGGTLTAGSATVSGDDSKLSADGVNITNPTDKSDVKITGNLTVDNGGAAEAVSGGNLTAGSVTLGDSTHPGIDDKNSSLTADGSGSTITVDGDVNVVGSNDEMNATNGGSITINGGTGLNVADGTTGFTLNMDDGELNVTNGGINTGKKSKWDLKNNSKITAKGSIKIGDNSTDISLGNGTEITTGGDLSTGNNSILTAGDGTKIKTGTDLTTTPPIITGGDINTGDNSTWTFGNNTTIDTTGGDINIGDKSTLTIGGGTVNAGTGTVTVGIADGDGDGGKLSLGSGTTLSAEDMTLNDHSTLSLDAESKVVLSGTLQIGTDPLYDNITGEPLGNGDVTLDLNNLSLTANNEDNLIVAGNIDGDFSNITIGGKSIEDEDSFITNVQKHIKPGRDASGNPTQTFQITYDGLAWYAASNVAQGTFDVSTSFKLGVQLNDRIYSGASDDPNSAPFTSGYGNWNGETLTKTGIGNLILSGNNTYSGGTNLMVGTITVGSNNALGKSTGTINMNTGTILAFDGQYSSTNKLAISNAIKIGYNGVNGTSVSGSKVNINVANNNQATINGQISGSGDLYKDDKGELVLTQGNTYTGNTYLDGGTLTIKNQNALSSGNLTISDGTTFGFGDADTMSKPAGSKYSYKFSNQVSIKDNSTHNSSFTIDVAGTSLTTAWIMNGINSSTSNFTKTGGGILILGQKGKNTTLGSVTVTDGGLSISGGSDLTTNGDVTVTNGSNLTLGEDTGSGGKSTLDTNSGDVTVDDSSSLDASSGSEIDTDGGDVTVDNTSELHGYGDLTIDTSGGNATDGYGGDVNVDNGSTLDADGTLTIRTGGGDVNVGNGDDNNGYAQIIGGDGSTIDTTVPKGTVDPSNPANIGGNVTVDVDSSVTLGDEGKILTGGGDVTVTDGSNLTSGDNSLIDTTQDGTNGGEVDVNLDSTLTLGSGSTINTGGSDVNITGGSTLAGTGDLTIDTGEPTDTDKTGVINTGPGGNVNVDTGSTLDGSKGSLDITTGGGDVTVDNGSNLYGGADSTIDTTTTDDTYGEDSNGAVLVDNGSTMTLGDGSTVNTGDGGLTVDNSGNGSTDSTITIGSGSEINTNGGDVAVDNSGDGSGNSTMNIGGGSTINTSGSDGNGNVTVDNSGNGSGSSTMNIGDGTIITTGGGSTTDNGDGTTTNGGSVIVDNSGDGSGSSTMNIGGGGKIDTSGGDGTGGVSIDNSGGGSGNSTMNIGDGTIITTGDDGGLSVDNSGEGSGNSTMNIGDGSTINTNGGDVTVDNSGSFAGDSNLNIGGGSTINTDGGDVIVNNTGDGSGDSNMTLGDGTTINTGGGEVKVDNTGTDTGDSTMTLGDGSAINTGGGDVTVDHGSEMHGTGDLAIDTSATDENGKPITGGNVNVDNGATLDADGSLDITTGGGNVNAGSGTGSTGNASIIGGDNSNIDTTIDGGTGGDVNIKNNSDITLGDGSTIKTGGGDVTVDNTSELHGTGDLSIDTSGGDPATNTGGKDGGTVTVNNGSTIDADGSLDITTGGGNIVIGKDSQINGGTGSDINTSDGKGGYGDIIIDNGSNINIGDDSNVNTGNITPINPGDINKGNDSSVTIGDNSTLNAKNITVGDNSTIGAGNNSNINATGDITMGHAGTYGDTNTETMYVGNNSTIHAIRTEDKDGNIITNGNITINGGANLSIGVNGNISADGILKITGDLGIDISAYDPANPEYAILKSNGGIDIKGINLTVGGSEIAETSNKIGLMNFLFEKNGEKEIIEKGIIGGKLTEISDSDTTTTPTEIDVDLGKLVWYNDESTRAHGYFFIDEGKDFTLFGTLANNTNLPNNVSNLGALGGTGADSSKSWDGKTLTKIGTGDLILSANNSYTGGTHLEEGGIYAGHNSALGLGLLTMNDGTTFGFAQSGLNIANDIKLGSLSESYDPEYVPGDDPTPGIYSTAISPYGAPPTYTFDVQVNGTLSGAIDIDSEKITGNEIVLNKTGAGILTLAGDKANTYTGTTNLKAGGIIIGKETALGKSTLVMSDQTVLGFGGDFTITNNIEIHEDIQAYFNTNGNTGTLAGELKIDDTGTLVKTGSGALNLDNKKNDYTKGTFIVNSGELNIILREILPDDDITPKPYSVPDNEFINNGRLNFVNQGTSKREIDIAKYDSSSTGIIGITASATNKILDNGLWSDKLVFLNNSQDTQAFQASQASIEPNQNYPDKIGVQFNFNPGSSMKNLASLGDKGLVFATREYNKDSNNNPIKTEVFYLSGIGFLSGAYELGITSTDNELDPDHTDDSVWARYNSSAGKVYSEAAAATLGQATDMNGLNLLDSLGKAVKDANEGSNSTGIYAGYGNSDIRHNTGSHADVKGNNFSIAAAWKKGNLAFGIFGQKFDGSYTTTNDATVSGRNITINSNGDLNSHNIGVFVELLRDGQNHGEAGRYYLAQLNNGNTSNDFRSYNAVGGSTFHSSRRMVGGSIGGGLIKNSGNDRTTEYYTHLIGTGLYSDSVTDSLGQRIVFSGAKSMRLLSGMRITRNKTQKTSSYFGAALDYEFTSSNDVYVDGNKANGADLKGLTGILEAGVTFKRSDTLSIDLGLQAYVGKRQGFSGNLLFRKAF